MHQFQNLAHQGRKETIHIVGTILIVLSSFMGVGQIPLAMVMSKLQKEGLVGNQSEMMELIGFNTFFILILIPFAVALLALLLCMKYIHQRNPLEVFTFRKVFDWKRFRLAFVIWGVFLLALFLLSLPFDERVVLNYQADQFWYLLIIALVFLPLQTAFEEAFFRGYLLQYLGLKIHKAWKLVLYTGILFGLLHAMNPEVQLLGYGLVIYYIWTGVFLGLMAIFDNGLELSLGYHTANNLFAALIVTNSWQAFQTDALFMDYNSPEMGVDVWLTLLLFQPLLLLIFNKKYGWKNWKKVLQFK